MLLRLEAEYRALQVPLYGKLIEARKISGREMRWLTPRVNRIDN